METILAGTIYQDGYGNTDNYPRITRDGGTTWNDVVGGLPTGKQWNRACFSEDGKIMYLFAKNDGIYKSFDYGYTWGKLTNFNPAYGTFKSFANNTGAQNSVRLRCSQDGSIVAIIDWWGDFWYSIDGGTTWNHINLAYDLVDSSRVLGNIYTADFGMSIDGSTFVVAGGITPVGYNRATPHVWISTDSGTTWSNDKRDILPTWIQYPTDPLGYNGFGVVNVNISPDGAGIIVVYDKFLNVGSNVYGLADISTDGGVTWKQTTPFLLQALAGGYAGYYVSSYIVPPGGVWAWSTVNETKASLGQTEFNTVLSRNNLTKAWYPWHVSEGEVNGETAPYIHDVKYIQNPGSINAPDGIFKYITSAKKDLLSNGKPGYTFTFSECSDDSYQDWDYANETSGLNYNSYFETGYKLHGQAIRKWQPEYVQIYSRNESPTTYEVQGVWNFAIDPNSGRYSNKQKVTINKPLFGMATNRLRIRGSGLVMQLKISSLKNNPFDIMGWSIMETQNAND